MKIGVLLKQVPDTGTKIKIVDDRIDESEIKWVMNPYDEFAVEAALRLREKVGSGEIVILSAGPVRAVEAIRQALAMGADRGVRIDPEAQALDPFLTAEALAAAAKTEGFNIIFAGKQAVDDDAAQVHIGVAEFLGWPHVSPVNAFEISADHTSATLSRPVSGGMKEIVVAKLPVVIGCDKGLNEPRYASLPGIMKAKSKPIAELKAGVLLKDKQPRLAQSHFGLPPEGRRKKMIQGTPAEAVKELVRLLREEAKVI